MYDDLVKRLRELHPEEFGNKWDFAFACQQAMHEAADAIEELSKRYLAAAIDNTNLTGYLAEEYAKHQWVSVTERLPELGVSVFTYCPAIRNIEIQSLEKRVGNLHWENQHGDWQDLEAVDLWMPLPPLPPLPQPPEGET